MRLWYFPLVLLAGFAYGQTAAMSADGNGNRKESSAAEAAGTSKVSPDDPVITIHDFCGDPPQEHASCRTVITRAQFEKLTEALQSGMSLALRLKVANAYARNLKMSAVAEELGLDRTPAFEEELRYARMQLLAQDLDRSLRDQANRISDEDIAAYYKKNQPSFVQATVARIFVPQTKPAAGKTETEHPENDMSKVATSLRQRALQGEDPDKLQIEAYAEAGIERTTVHTELENVRRDTLPIQHESVMDLKPGEVSEVFSDPDGAHFIYKMIGKKTLNLEDARPEIRTAISTQRYRDSIKSFEGNVVFSDDYFNPPNPGAPRTAKRRNSSTGQK